MSDVAFAVRPAQAGSKAKVFVKNMKTGARTAFHAAKLAGGMAYLPTAAKRMELRLANFGTETGLYRGFVAARVNWEDAGKLITMPDLTIHQVPLYVQDNMGILVQGEKLIEKAKTTVNRVKFEADMALISTVFHTFVGATSAVLALIEVAGALASIATGVNAVPSMGALVFFGAVSTYCWMALKKAHSSHWPSVWEEAKQAAASEPAKLALQVVNGILGEGKS